MEKFSKKLVQTKFSKLIFQKKFAKKLKKFYYNTNKFNLIKKYVINKKLKTS